jgi:predicted outer membrane protein
MDRTNDVVILITDKALLKEMHAINLAEIEEAALAEERARSEPVKIYSRELKREHAKADALVTQEAERLGIVLDDALPNDQQSAIDRLKEIDTADFDRTFLQTTVDQNELMISKVDTAEKADNRVRRLCDRLLPELHQQAMDAKRLEVRTANNFMFDVE